jgi:hypothetical protein
MGGLISNDTTICDNEETFEIEYEGGEVGYTYSWSPATGLSATNIPNPEFTVAQQGNFTYVVTVTDTFGCSKKDTIDIEVKDAGDIPMIIRNGDSLSSNIDMFAYIWLINDSIAVEFFNQKSIKINKPGTYILAGVNDNICGVVSDELVVDKLSIAEKTSSNITLYPNPAQDQITFELDNISAINSVEVYNSKGTLVNVKTTYTNNKGNVNIDNLSAGMYYIKLITNKKVYNGTFIKL